MNYIKRGLSIFLCLVMTINLVGQHPVKASGGVNSSVNKTGQTDMGKSEPAHKEAFEYSLYTGNAKADLEINASKSSIKGDIHSNSNFVFKGSKLDIDGKCEAYNKVAISKKLSPKNNCEIYENVNKVNMPYYENQILEYLKKQGTDEYYGKHSLKGPHVDISNGLIANGSLSISSSKFAGNGIIYANDELSYSVSSLSNLSKGKLVLCSANGDINIHASNTDINGIIYAPNGKVTITGANVTINGRIIADEFNFRGSNLTINSADNDLDILDFLFLPSVEIKAEGELKENRKVVLDISHLDKIEELAKEDIIWKISNIDDGDKLEAVEGLHYAIDDLTSDEFTKNMVFKKYGKYEIEVIIKSGNAVKSNKIILDIKEDIVPIADFTIDNTYYLRDSDYKAKIKLKDSSFTIDNDGIGKRVWTVYHDLNNDGVFDDRESEIISDGNKTDLIYETNKVGNFKVELTVIEDLTNTIPSLISEEDYKRGNTDNKDSDSKEFTIGNIKPESNVDVGLAKDVDLVFTVGSADINTINTYGDKINDIKTELEEDGYNVKLSTVSTTSLTAQDTFAWKEYDHYNYVDSYLPTLPKHILYEGSSIKMLGYGRAPLKDFLIVEDENPSQKIFEFDIQRDTTDWHSMEGGGFLFNTSVVDGRIKGFYILITQGGLKLMEIKGLPVDSFQNGSTASLTQLRTFPLSNLYDEHHFKIIVEEDSITLWDDDKLIIDNYKLPDNNYGNGYGPITSHASHACRQQSYFTFNNITMQTITGENLSDVLANYDWTSNTSRYVINLSDSTLEEFEIDEEIAEVAKQILESNINFIGIGNGENNEQYSSIINSAANNGIYLDSNDINLSSSNLANYIMSSENTKDFSVDYYISKDQPVRYIDSYSDYENDPLYEQVWEYEYDPSVFAGNKEDGKVKSFTSETPITKFSETGAYSVKLKVRDNPVGDNDALDEYRLWSDESQSKKVLMVHNRPISKMDIAISVDTSDSSKCLINVKEDCFDPDYKDIKGKGIVSKEYKWKSLHDADWTNGMIPSKVDMGEIYLISLTATDQEGEVSAPCVEVVNTGNAIEIDPSTRPVIVNNIPELVGVGESFEIIIEATSSVGIDKLEVYLNEELINLSDSKYVFIPRELGEYTLRITITDKNGIQWDVEKVMTVVITDKEAPLVDIIFDKDIYIMKEIQLLLR